MMPTVACKGNINRTVMRYRHENQGDKIMVSMNDVHPTELIEKAAESLKKLNDIKPPEWAPFVKTGVHKERPPVREDWWYARSAAVLRKVAILGPIGVSKLRTKYGGKKNRGHKPDKFFKGSGNIIRKVLQQLEKAGLIKQINKSGKKGRIITPKGTSLLTRAAFEASKTQKKERATVTVAPAEPKPAPAKPQPKNPEQQPKQ